MSFIRPEVQTELFRWRESLIGAASMAAGFYLAVGPGRGRLVLGLLLLGLGTLFFWWGLQRARFRRAGGGAGMVEVDERQITYFGPDIGGALALEDLTRISVVPPHAWELVDINGQRLTIPVNAEGTDALFETFVALPGFSATKLAGAAQAAPEVRTVIWSKLHAPAG
jgi:hypothetical protein